MIENKPYSGKLILDYTDGEGLHHCICSGCGLRTIFTDEQYKEGNSCACEARKLLLAQTNIVDDNSEMIRAMNTFSTSQQGRGINFDKGKWRVRITFQSKEYNLGYCLEKNDAVALRKEAEEKINDGVFMEWYENTVQKTKKK